MLSTGMGCGIISVPYAMTVVGLQFGITMTLMGAGFLFIGVYLYMKAREVYKIDAHSDLSYMCFGQKGVYISNFLIRFYTFMGMIMFLMIFSSLSIVLFGSPATNF